MAQPQLKTDKAPDLSLIIPVHSGIDKLDTLFHALLKLKLHTFIAECIFIADKCPQKNIEMIRQKCQLVRSNGWLRWRVIPSDFGNPDLARQLGIEHATGHTIAFLDDDCRPCREWLVTGMLRLKSHTAVTGPVCHKDTIWGQLVAVMDFGEFQSKQVKKMNNMPGCNLFVSKNKLIKYPMVQQCQYGGDRVLANWISAGQKNIGYYPGIAVDHRPPLTISAIWNRETRYGSVAWMARKMDTSLPWSGVLKFGFTGVFVLTLGRFLIDLKRVWQTKPPILEKLALSYLLFPFRMAYFKGMVQAQKKR